MLYLTGDGDRIHTCLLEQMKLNRLEKHTVIPALAEVIIKWRLLPIIQTLFFPYSVAIEGYVWRSTKWYPFDLLSISAL